MYGYSVWLVPLNRRLLTKVYKFRHIPHITISTNHEDLPDPINLGKLYDIVDFKPYGIIGKQYAFDPLHATGWECTVEDLFIQHTPHMSHMYSFYRIRKGVACLSHTYAKLDRRGLCRRYEIIQLGGMEDN
jgi:hypothetical protein